MLPQRWPAEGGMTDIGLYLAANQNPIAQKASVPTALGIKPGDFVAFRVLAVRPPPAGIFGMPEALLKPSLDMDESCWQVEKVLFALWEVNIVFA